MGSAALTNRKLVIITGTSSGIGLAVAKQALRADWEVVGVSRRGAQIADPRYQHVDIDLADISALPRAFENRVASLVSDETLARVALVNNAASPALLAPLESLEPVALASAHALNFIAPVWLMGFMSRHCRHDVPLRIVNVSSGAAVHGFPGMAAYGSAKAALRMAGMVLAAEWQSTVDLAPTRTNAAILSYEPGVVDTPMQETAREQPAKTFPWVGMFAEMHAQRVLVSPDRPASEIVAFLETATPAPFSEQRLGEAD